MTKTISNHYGIMDGDEKIFVINPKTDRRIRVGGVVYKGLLREGKMKHPESDKKFMIVLLEGSLI